MCFLQKVRLHFTRFDVEGCDDCECDKVNIYDGKDMSAKLISTLCGHSLPVDIISIGNTVFVYFKSDVSMEFAGFRIQYTATNGKRNVTRYQYIFRKLPAMLEDLCYSKQSKINCLVFHISRLL